MSYPILTVCDRHLTKNYFIVSNDSKVEVGVCVYVCTCSVLISPSHVLLLYTQTLELTLPITINLFAIKNTKLIVPHFLTLFLKLILILASCA